MIVRRLFWGGFYIVSFRIALSYKCSNLISIGATESMGSLGQKRWLITGGSSGLGLAIAIAVLQGGDQVIATGRNVANAAREHPEFEELGGTWLQLDVQSHDATEVVRGAIQRAGGSIDVVVNNAGLLFLTSVEDAKSVIFPVGGQS